MKRTSWRLALILTSALTVPDSLHAIPAFARRYSVSCSLCHSPAPRLGVRPLLPPAGPAQSPVGGLQTPDPGGKVTTAEW